MSMQDKERCGGPGGCGHPRYTHNGTHLKGSKSACTKPMGGEGGRQIRCACRQFKP
jgi:hypothetical protein